MKNTKQTIFNLLAFIGLSGAASATIIFHTDFDEADLASITGLSIDTPSTTGANSGTITLNTAANTLDLTANGANLWTAREGAPIAWVDAPTVALGETWYVETQVNMVNDIGANAATYDQAGITFYGGPDGANPGGIDAFGLLLNDWGNTWTAQNPALSVGGAANVFNAPLTPTDNNILFRTEITEGGASDTYNFFYKEEPVDPWIQMGGVAINRVGSFDNSRVALFLKSNDANTNGAAQFDYFTIGTVIPEPNSAVLAGLGGLLLLLRRRISK